MIEHLESRHLLSGTAAASDNSEPVLLADTNIYTGDGLLRQTSYRQGTRVVDVGGTGYFFAQDGLGDVALWRTDATGDGTERVRGAEIVDGQPGPANADQLTAVDTTAGPRLFFTVTRYGPPATMHELWVSDGTSAGTIRVAQSSSSGVFKHLTPLDGPVAGDGLLVFYRQRNEPVGSNAIAEIWVSDGTTGGTRLISEVPGVAMGGASIDAVRASRAADGTGRVYFTIDIADSNVPYGRRGELWTTDGTELGTRKLLDQSATASMIDGMAVNGRFVFRWVSEDPFSSVFVTDGTPEGTEQILFPEVGTNFPSGANHFALLDPGDGTPGSQRAAFLSSVEGGVTWFVTDGTAPGTRRMFEAGAAPGGLPDAFTNVYPAPPVPKLWPLGDGTAIFFYPNPTDADRPYLWRTDGSAGGTTTIAPAREGYQPNIAAEGVAGGRFYWGEYRFGEIGTLYATDGTTEGTHAIRRFPTGHNTSGPPGAPFDLAGFALLPTSTREYGLELWRSDGTAGGTELLKDIADSTLSALTSGLVRVNDTFLFRGGGGNELWTTDGTPAGTVPLLPPDHPLAGTFSTGFGVGYTAEVAGGIVFSGFDLATETSQIYFTDGTAEGTRRVTSDDGVGASLPLGYLPGSFEGVAYFGAELSTGYSNNNRELWRTDGTKAGTYLLKDIWANDRYRGSDPGGFTVAPTPEGDRLFFTADTPAYGLEIWISDGTSDGTRRLTDIIPGYNHSGVGILSAHDSGLWFRSTAFWVTDGTEAGTRQVFMPPSGASTRFMGIVGNELFMSVTTGAYATASTEIWAITPQGNRRTVAALGNTYSLQPKAAVVETDRGETLLFFTADEYPIPGNSQHKVTSLWRTDGTAEGTVQLDHLVGGGYSLTAAAGKAYLDGFDAGGRWLWESDGSPEGTGRVARLSSQSGIFGAAWATEVLTDQGERVIYFGYDEQHGREPHRLDPHADRLFAHAGPPLVIDESVAHIALAGSAHTSVERNIVSWEWDLNYDGTGFDADAVGQNYDFATSDLDGPGSFSVALRVTDDAGVSHVDSAVITVLNAPPAVSATLDEELAAVGQTLTLSLSVEDPGDDVITRYSVSWGDGTTGSLNAATGELGKAYTAAGTFRITVTAYDEDGGYTAEPITVEIVARPAVEIGSDRSLPEGQALDLTASINPESGPIDLWEWDFGYDGVTFTPDAVGEVVSHVVPDGPSVTAVAVRVSNEVGSAIDSFLLTAANVDPTIAISEPSKIREGLPFTIPLNATDPGNDTITSWLVDWGDGTRQTLAGSTTSVSHTYANGPASPFATITAVDEDGSYTVALGRPGGEIDATFGTDGRVFIGSADNDLAHLPVDAVARSGGAGSVTVGYRAATQETILGYVSASGEVEQVVRLVLRNESGGTLYPQAIDVADDGSAFVLMAPSTNDRDNGLPRYIAKIDNGSLDPTWGMSGLLRLDLPADAVYSTVIHDLAVSPDGRVTVAGRGFSYDADAGKADPVFWAARLNATGVPDTSFGGAGDGWARLLAGESVRLTGSAKLALLPDGRAAIGGLLYRPLVDYSVRYEPVVFRLNRDGTPDTVFGEGGQALLPGGSNFQLQDLDLAQDGRVLLTAAIDGSYAAADGQQGPFTALLAADGSIVGITSVPEQPHTGWIARAIFTPEGRFVTALQLYGSDERVLLRQFNSDATLDNTFGTGGRVTLGGDLGSLTTLITTGDQKMQLLAGGVTNSSGSRLVQFDLARGLTVDNVAPELSVDPPFYPAVGQVRLAGVVADVPADVPTLTLDLGDGRQIVVPLSSIETAAGQWRFDFVADYRHNAADGPFTVRLIAADEDGGATMREITVTPVVPASILARHVFYNRSYFDGNNAAANTTGGPSGTGDDGAIASDKQALLPGNKAAFANYSSYSRGLNGIMIDIASLPAGESLSAADFTFRVGNGNDPSTWSLAPTPIDVSVRRGAGEDGSDRVTLIWADHAIQKQWLQVSVLPTAHTGLAEADVFYFGNAVGETGNAASDGFVNASDVIGTRDNPRGLFNRAPIDFRYDFNRDGLVNASDVIIARDNQTGLFNSLRLINPAASANTSSSFSTGTLSTTGSTLSFNANSLINPDEDDEEDDEQDDQAVLQLIEELG